MYIPLCMHLAICAQTGSSIKLKMLFKAAHVPTVTMSLLVEGGLVLVLIFGRFHFAGFFRRQDFNQFVLSSAQALLLSEFGDKIGILHWTPKAFEGMEVGVTIKVGMFEVGWDGRFDQPGFCDEIQGCCLDGNDIAAAQHPDVWDDAGLNHPHAVAVGCHFEDEVEEEPFVLVEGVENLLGGDCHKLLKRYEELGLDL